MKRTPCYHQCEHPGAKYFAIGKVDKEQVADYAQRKGSGRGGAVVGAGVELLGKHCES